MATIAAEIFIRHGRVPTIKWSRSGKNLIQLLAVEREFGRGKRAAPLQKIRKDGTSETHYRIDHMDPKLVKGELRNGKVFGTEIWHDRKVTSKPIQIVSALKHDWVLVPNLPNVMDLAIRQAERKKHMKEREQEAAAAGSENLN